VGGRSQREIENLGEQLRIGRIWDRCWMALGGDEEGFGADVG